MSAEQHEETLVQKSTESVEKKETVAKSASEGKSRVANRRQKPTGTDPYIRNLFVLAAIAIIGALLTMVFAVLTGVINFDQTRITNVDEFSVARATVYATVEEAAGSTGQLALSLIANGQLSDANALIQEALQREWPDTERNQGIMFAYAALAEAQGDFDTAIERYEYVMTELRDAFETMYASDVEPNWARGFGLHSNYYDAAVALAFIHEQLGDYEGQLEALDVALRGYPNAADLLTWRGQIHLALGDNEAAIADFNNALRFVSDSEEALQGLEEAGGTAND